MPGSKKFDRFRLTPEATRLRAEGGWGVREGSKIKRFLDAAEAAGANGEVLHRKHFPDLTPRYASWLNSEGYLKPVREE